MNIWILKKLREEYIVQYTVSNNIRITKKDFTHFHYIQFDFYIENFYSFMYKKYICKWYYPSFNQHIFVNKLLTRDKIRNNKKSVRTIATAKKHWIKVNKTQHSEQEITP
jgi:hypothetical protein